MHWAFSSDPLLPKGIYKNYIIGSDFYRQQVNFDKRDDELKFTIKLIVYLNF